MIHTKTLRTVVKEVGADFSCLHFQEMGPMVRQKYPADFFVLPFLNKTSVLLTKLYWCQERGKGILSCSYVGIILEGDNADIVPVLKSF